MVLGDEATDEAAELYLALQAATGVITEEQLLAAVHALGTFYYQRWGALPVGPDVAERARSIVLFDLIAQAPELVPDELRSLLGATADPIAQGVTGAQLVEASDSTPDPILLEAAIKLLMPAIEDATDVTFRNMLMGCLALACQSSYERSGELEDLNRTIDVYREVIAVTPEDDPRKPSRLVNLGNAYRSRYDRTGEAHDLDQAFTLFEQAIAADPSNVGRRGNLGLAYQSRYERTGVPEEGELVLNESSRIKSTVR